MFAWVLLLDAVVPLSEQVEGVWVGHVINKNDLVHFAQQIKSNLLEDVLARDVNQVELCGTVSPILGWHGLDLVFAALSHHVVVVE